MQVLLLDNYDSFTYMLKDFIEQCGAVCDVFRNDDEMPRSITTTYDALVISPGPGIPSQSGQTMELIRNYYEKMPILGVCLGHQAIGQFFGAELVHAMVPMHGKQSQIELMNEEIFNGMPKLINVTRYHSLVIKNLPKELEATAFTNEGEVMAIRHKTLPIRGVQFHPESCLTENGLAIIKNFLTLAAQ
jgi:para-aminobenzoate synthetase component II